MSHELTFSDFEASDLAGRAVGTSSHGDEPAIHTQWSDPWKVPGQMRIRKKSREVGQVGKIWEELGDFRELQIESLEISVRSENLSSDDRRTSPKTNLSDL